MVTTWTVRRPPAGVGTCRVSHRSRTFAPRVISISFTFFGSAYTTGSAYAEFEEKEKGTLAPGMLADFVVLDRDITKVKPEEILKTKVLRTVVGGQTVYEAK